MKQLLLVPFFLFIVSCSTPYQKFSNNPLFGSQDGFSEYQIDENTFSVSFRGNEFTSKPNVYASAIKRSAEVVKSRGFRFFAVIAELDRTSKVDKSTFGGGIYIPNTVDYPAITLHIRVHNEPNEGLIDAEQILGGS